ncbi:MAG: ABC transporter permease, partial [Bacteroidetes bacterium]
MNMFKSYFQILLRKKVHAFVTIGSFSVSLALIVVLGAFLASEFSYDRHIDNIDHIYRVVGLDNDGYIPEQTRQLMLEKIPEVKHAANYHVSSEPVVFEKNNYSARVIHSDEGIFSVLPVELSMGNPRDIFEIPTHAVITESFAQKVFGDENPIGKMINMSHRVDLIVSAVMKDFPQKSTLHGDVIVSSDLKLRYSSSCYDDNCTYFYHLLLKLNPNAIVSDVAPKVSAMVPVPENKQEKEYTLLPYKNAYFDTSVQHDGLEHANIKMIQLLAWLTFLLIALSVFNYVSLSVGHNFGRLKEFGIKKVFGIGKIRLVSQFVFEAFLTILLSLTIALYLAFLIKPVFEGMFGKPIHLEYLFNTPLLIVICFLSLVGIALVIAIYPARMALQAQAKDLISNRLSQKTGGYDFRKALITIQFAASIAVLMALFVVTRQVNFVKTKDFGFSTEHLVRIPVHWQAKDKVSLLIDRLFTIPGVVNACYSHGTPGSILNSSMSLELGSVSLITADNRFVETFELPLLEGRNFHPRESNDVCIVNKSAMKQAGWESIEGKDIFGGNIQVVGLLDDFHFQDMYHEIGALIILYDDDVSHITARIASHDISNTLGAIKKTFEEILPEHEYFVEFYDEFLGAMYQQEERRAATMKIVAVIALFISCIGLFGMVDFSMKKRVKEIGIHKVNGAKTWEVMLMLNRDFVKWVGIAFVIATPIAYYAMNKWLQNFAYRTLLSWWMFALAGLLVLGIGLLTVSWQSWRAARRNPVE